jgi:hypothetical protein
MAHLRWNAQACERFGSRPLAVFYPSWSSIVSDLDTCPVTRRNIKGRPFWTRVWVLASVDPRQVHSCDALKFAAEIEPWSVFGWSAFFSLAIEPANLSSPRGATAACLLDHLGCVQRAQAACH